MTRIGLVDCSAVVANELAPPRFPSPALLAVEGDTRYVELADVAEAAIDRVIAVVPPWSAAFARPILDGLKRPVEIIDPWSTPMRPARYDRVPRACHSDVDLAPHRWPVHPWIVESPHLTGDPEARLRAAFAGLDGQHTTQLVLGDERTRLTLDRMRTLAELVTASVRDRSSLVELAMRVWPEDLAGARIVEHVSLLPIAGLDLLIGSVHAPTMAARGGMSPDDVAKLIAAIAKAGLAHLTTLSIALALPGETVRDTIGALNRALQIAIKHRLAAVRCAIWIGPGGPPADPAEEQQRFAASHPEWSVEEYRGMHDLVALIRDVAKGIELVGPGFLPSWDVAP